MEFKSVIRGRQYLFDDLFLVLLGRAYLYLTICIVWFTQFVNFNKALMISSGYCKCLCLRSTKG